LLVFHESEHVVELLDFTLHEGVLILIRFRAKVI
jgi:hypothetical protein